MEGTPQRNSGVFNSVADAVAELDRRDAEREPETNEAQESDEDTETDSSAETGVEESGEDVATEDESKEEKEEAKTSIEFDGKTLEIPKGTPPEIVEAVQKLGNDLKADYTRKTQAVAEEKKLIESAKEQAIQQSTQLQRVQASLAQMAQALIGQKPDLSLAQTDPQTYLIQNGIYEQRVAQFNALMQEGQQLTQQQEQEQAQMRADFQRREADALLKAMPELAAPEKFQAFRTQAISVGEKYGFKPEEIAALGDHRFVLALRDLAKFHKGQAAAGSLKGKLQNVPPKVAKPGTTQPGDSKSQRAAEAKREFLKSDRGDRALRRYLAATS